MIILGKDSENFNLDNLRKFILNKNKRKYIILICLIFLSYLPALTIKYSKFPQTLKMALIKTFGESSFVIGHLSYESSFYGNAYRLIKALSIPDEKLQLSLDFKSISDLQKEREKALINGYINPFMKKEVKGEITYKDKSIPISVRLKGDNIEHLKGEKWSMRVKGKSDNTILGMREFSLQQPSIRNYFGEMFYHLLLKSEGLPSLRYQFKTLIFNGKNLGAYAIEEHFDKILLENNNFREGPIIKLSENNMFIEAERRYKIFNERLPTNELQKGEIYSEVVPFNKNKLYKNIPKYNQFLRARNRLHLFLLGELEMEDVFDLELTAKYFALNDLLFVSHANSWNNIRFYYNPVSGKLIPIGYDADVPIIHNLEKYPDLSIDRNLFGLFESQIFVKEYIKFLEKYSEPEFLENFLLKNKKEINTNLLNIQRSYPFVRYIEDVFIKSQKYIKIRINPSEPIIARIKEINKNNIKLLLANRYNLPIEIDSIYKDRVVYKNSERKKLVKNNSERFQFKLFNFDNPFISKEKLENKNILLKYRIMGKKDFLIKEINLQNIDSLDNKKINNDLNNIKDNFKNVKFFEIDDFNKKITIKKGSWEINKPLILPIGFSLHAKEGTELEFTNQSYILMSGKISLIGLKDDPIKIKSDNNGGSIIIRNSKEESIFQNVIFSNLKLPNLPHLGITGNITFYNSPVKISDSSFLNLNAEDSLNIIGSNLKLNNSYFKGSSSDALDLDFVKAKMNNVYFENIGNDAIDISGSQVNAENIFISRAQDKGISVGEKSNFFIKGINIQSTNIAFASKDLSSLFLEKVDLRDNGLCFTAFKKKDEYGPGFIKILDESVDNNELKSECQKSYLLEFKSEIKNNDELFEINSYKVYDQLYGNQFGKKTIK